MKRLLSIIVISCFIFAAGCSNKNKTETSRFTIVTSFYPIYIIAKNVSRDVPGVTVINLTPPVTGCLHDYNVSADDMKKLEKADILLINGLGMESFMDTIIGRYSSLKTAALTNGVLSISDERGINPHAWVSLSLYAKMVENCIAALGEKDREYAKNYRTSGTAYLKKVNALKKEMDSSLLSVKDKKIITFHEAFPYFAQEYGLIIAAVVEREPGTEPSAKELSDSIELVRSSGIKAIFTEPQYPSFSAQTIARETEAKVYTLDPGVTGPDEYDAYIKIMKKNGSILKEALAH